MLDSARQVAAFAQGMSHEQSLEDVRTRYAIERVLEIIGEAARRVSLQTRESHPEISWSGIIGFRNLLAHQYGAIDYRRMYVVIMEGVPVLIEALQRILDSLEES